MKRILLFTALIFGAGVYAQSHKAGTLSLQGNYEMGFMGTYSETKFDETVIGKDTSAALVSSFHLGVHYSLVEFLSLGFYGQLGSYVESEENIESSGNRFLCFGAALRAYPLNKDNFNWYIGGRAGFSSLGINRQTGVFTEDYVYSSPEFVGETGFNWYPMNFLGVNFGLNYQYRKYDLKEYRINNNALDLSNISNYLKASGLGVSLGLSLKIN